MMSQEFFHPPQAKLKQSSAKNKVMIPLLVMSLLLFVESIAWCQHDMHDMEHMHDEHSQINNQAMQAKLLSDKRESEFNHHLSGFLLILAGALIFMEDRLARRLPQVRYAWPFCFLLAGLFILAFSDTELWPFGPQSWLYGISTDHEVLQHKLFAVILLGLGVIETLRIRGTLKGAWASWIFPIVAVSGAILLLFHSHEAGMHGPNAM